ncbi:glycosyltransferase family 4 protein [Verrucomicrobium sp. 3C]|uniref:glycosyltransferase family 4 protein n=1 Tax=Verrucomicrobium sp. 3C TaxID=1134055 RepID=UPI000378C8C4|nr:glycosyltransferase family 4 protein [Verrucomicrobium sp. 3C]
MRIAQIAPPVERVPPEGYGGTERVVSFLTEALIDLGHEVTLFASGDSVTRARLRSVCPQSLRKIPACRDYLPYFLLEVDAALRSEAEFDLLHFHTELLHFPFFRSRPNRSVTTLHLRLDTPELAVFFHGFPEMPVVAISEAQRQYIPHANWAGTVPHGLPENLYSLGNGSGGYLLFLGRISVEKRPDLAIEIARRAGLELLIAAKMDPRHDADYIHALRPLLSLPHVHYLGEANEYQKQSLIGDAVAMLLPIQWPEPFGLSAIEALACGTPVIGFPYGAIPEILEPGTTGFLAQNVEEAAQAVPLAAQLSRKQIRLAFEKRFTAERMARDYLAIYDSLLGRGMAG